MEKTMKVTVAEFQEMKGISYAEANSLLNILKVDGQVSLVGQRKRADGLGKPSNIFEIPQRITLQLFTEVDIPKVIENESVNESVEA